MKSGLFMRYSVVYVLICALIIIAACAATTSTTTSRQPAQEPPKEEKTQQAQEQAKQQTQEEIIKKELSYARSRAYSLGIYPYMDKNYEQALPDLLKVAQIDKQIYQTFADVDTLKYPVIYKQIGICYQERGIIDSAYYYYNEGYVYYDSSEVYKSNKNEMDNYKYILQWLQWYYSENQQTDKYIEFSEKFLMYEQDKAKRKVILEPLKTIYIKQQEYDKALEKLEELLEIEPDNREFESEWINAIRITGGDEALIKVWEEKHLENPADAEIIWNLINIYENQLEYAKVIEFADKYLALNSDDIDARVKKANALEAVGKFDQAIVLWQELNKLRPGNPQYLLNIARIYHFNKENYQEAVKWAYNARQIDTGFGEASLKIADVIVSYITVVMGKYGRETPDIDDKLIYEVAIEYFKDATNNQNTRNRANQLLQHYNTESFIRTPSDIHMNKGHDAPGIPEYSWVWKYKK
ncbi:hypothetical protein AMJ80_11950 [bacterium SM23_31]|nr:MAG: hypothetical protein AMJ80_11950 [bacterium SM23_31]